MMTKVLTVRWKEDRQGKEEGREGADTKQRQYVGKEDQKCGTL